MTYAIYRIQSLSFRKESADAAFTLEVPRLTVKRGDQVALSGPSGCGKSTLLDLLSMIALPDSAERFDFSPSPDNRVSLASYRENRKDRNRLAVLRKYHIGYILQTGGLLPFLDIWSNIQICQELTGRIDKEWLMELAQYLGIEHHFKKKPAALSTGERQRVAVARALAHKPSVVIADEPTASLDPDNADKVLELLVSLTRRLGTTLLLATHDVSRIKTFNLSQFSQYFGEGISQKNVVSFFED